MDIVPGILATTVKELKEQLDRVKWAKKVHIDIMDGKFVPNKTIQALTLKKYLPNADIQIHLMCKKPHQYISQYARMGAKEFIIHAEATKNTHETLEDIRLAGMKSGIAFNPETRISQHKDALIHADLALIMTVHPGHSGQRFMKTPLTKIEQIKKHNPLVYIGVDGGVNLNTCQHACTAGAHWGVATSAVTKADNPKRAYTELLKKCT